LFGRLLQSANYIFGFHGARGLQNPHPLLVHFPIAFLTAAPIVYLLAWLKGDETWAWSGLWILALGTLGAAAAVWTGLGASDSVMIAPSVREHILIYHRALMMAAFGLSIIMSSWALIAPPLPRRWRGVFIAMLLVMAALISIGADFGGWMVYGYNAGGSLPQPIEFSS
jgi:uncharacterized membrane protein